MQIFLLDPERTLSPEQKATVLARYSRSPLSATIIVKEVTQDRADKFFEQNVVKYGHKSVGELATVEICFEGVSILAAKELESMPRAAYSEKSTRYQEFKREDVHIPSSLKAVGDLAPKVNSLLFDAYEGWYPQVFQEVCRKTDKDPEDPKVKSSSVVKARVFDTLRYLLPCGLKTSVGVVINLTDLSQLIAKLLGHYLEECREIGQALKTVFQDNRLVRHTEANQSASREELLAQEECTLRDPAIYSYESVDHLVSIRDAHPLFRMNSLIHGEKLSYEGACLKKLLESRGSHDELAPLFAEYGTVTFDMVMDFSAFRDMQRHRRCTIRKGRVTNFHGYHVPEDLPESLKEPYHDLISESHGLLAFHPSLDEMEYCLPMATSHISRFTMDLRELFYISELRTKPHGHISYRRVAYDMYKTAHEVAPSFMDFCRVTTVDGVGEHT
jgi:thymidylate synthase ThyX